MCCIIYICIFLTSLLFPLTHYFIIISCVHDYSPFTSVFTPTTQCLIVLLYPCSVVVLICCYTRVYITLCTSCNNLQLQSQFDLITPIVILVTRMSLGVLFALPSCRLTSDLTMSDAPAVQPPKEHTLPPVSASVAAVSVKIPPFWPADPLVWFAQVEAQFATHNITSQRTRFDHVITALFNEFATEVRNIILSPLEVDAYSKLKDLLTKRTAASERKRLQLLFTSEEFGNRKPTQLLRQYI